MTIEHSTTLAEAIEYCRRTTRLRARNFYYGLKLAPQPQRSALFVVYAWMRRADDLVDSAAGGDASRLQQIDRFRAATDAALARRGTDVGGGGDHKADDDPLWIALAAIARQFDIRREDLHSMLDGQVDDLSVARYETFAQLRQYCYRVASTVGLICIDIWGYDNPDAREVAVNRGIAFQLTNIIRDFRQDFDAGRVYLPQEDFDRHGLTPQQLRDWSRPEAGSRLFLEQIRRAESFYAAAQGLDEMISAPCRPTLWAMTTIYHQLLDRMQRDPARIILSKRVRLTTWQKAMIALRARSMARPRALATARAAAGGGGAVKRTIAIIGAGLAGIAAAVRLVDAGLEPVLIETRRRLGGRATSFDDSRSGQTLDNCQHVLLGCCTNLVDLYDRLGVLDQIQWHRTLYFTGRNGRIDRLKAGWLPAPAHMAGSFARMGLLSLADKRQIARAMWRLIRIGAAGRQPWRDRTFGEFLRDCGQGENVIRRFWNVIIVSACNMDVERVNAAHAMHVFQDGFLANRWSYAMGLATGPLSGLYEPATPIIQAGGGEVRLGVSAKAIAFDGLRVNGVVTDDGMVNADAVISTVPFDRLDRLVSDSMRGADSRLGRLGEFAVSPILGVHLWFDRPIMDLPHMVLVDGGVQWLFNKGAAPDNGAAGGGGGEGGGGVGGLQHIHAVISAADEWMDMDEQQIIAAVVRDVHRALPHAVGLQPVQARAVKEKRATFASVPGVDAIRPGTSASYVGVGGGGISNLFLAGDWTDTGWPATMEGAVRSGYAAAAAVAGAGGLIEDIPAGRLARMLGLKS